jgi:hypothetical protein
VKVLFIMGSDRSGTTLLDLLMGSVEGFTAVGELSNIWSRGIIERRMCGCGQTFDRCDLWSGVMTRVFGHHPSSGIARQVIAFRREHLRLRHTWRLLREGGRDLDRYLELISRLHHAIAAESGARVIVDSSKDASDAAALTLAPDIDPYLLHLVRDPRAVTYSLGHRPKLQTDSVEPSAMRRLGVVRGTATWLAWNAAARRVHRSAPDRTVLLSYEHLTADPSAAITRVLELVGETNSVAPSLDDRTADIRVSHTVSGNPSRFATGRVEIRTDDEWRRAQPFAERMVTTALAAPLMLRYGYAPWGTGRTGTGR